MIAFAALAVVLQSLALYVPGDPDPSVSIPGLDKLAHVVLFAVPVWLWLRVGAACRLVVPLALAQVVASEVVQGRWIPHRAGDVWDAVADVIGIGLGVWWAGRPARAVGDRRPACRET